MRQGMQCGLVTLDCDHRGKAVSVAPFSSGRLVAIAGEWRLTADRRLRKGPGNLHA
jgi:hypothetical protein